jgi:hypothetical protein
MRLPIASVTVPTECTPSPPYAIASFTDATASMLSRSLRKAVDPLAEPRPLDRDHAAKILRCFVETMTGFALGTITTEVFAGVRPWFGDEIVAEAQAALRGRWPSPAREAALPETRYLEDAANRPLVEKLASRLHVRFCQLSPDVRALLATINDIVERRTPQQQHTIGVMLDLVQRTDTIETRLGDELAFGWTIYDALVSSRPIPSTEGRWHRSTALWQAWLEQLGMGAAHERSEHEEAGYVALIR